MLRNHAPLRAQGMIESSYVHEPCILAGTNVDHFCHVGVHPRDSVVG